MVVDLEAMVVLLPTNVFAFLVQVVVGFCFVVVAGFCRSDDSAAAFYVAVGAFKVRCLL